MKTHPYKYEVKKWYAIGEANAGIEDFIHECNESDIEIVDVASHVTETEDGLTYSFFFKLKR